MQPPPLFLQAQADLQAQRPQQAAQALNACVHQHPDFAPAFLALAALIQAAQPGTALQLLIHALDRFPEQRQPVIRALRTVLPDLTPRVWHPGLERALLACLDEDPQPLARFAARLLLLKHWEGDLKDTESDPLWHAFLTRCINVDPAMEARIRQLRQDVDAASPLLPALALQAFSNEYLVCLQDAQQRSPRALLDAPLIDLPHLVLPQGATWSDVSRRTRDDILEERRLAAALPSLAPLRDATSLAVRAQYEANPYPRWRNPPAPQPRPLRAFLARFGVAGDAPPQILVAGCGTGYEAIDLARTDPSAFITALDLSRASLGYAARMARELEVSNIRFIQGDILDLPLLGRSFDLVTSSGVLHHMAIPAAGLAALVAVTRPRGLLRLSLYSHHARTVVRQAHQLIRDRNWAADPDGIRAFRHHVLRLASSDPLASLCDSDDFYTLSGCRDLVFHTHEHHYKLDELRKLLDGLDLVGFDASPEAASRFRARFGDADVLDLDRWDRLEQEHPHLFAGMYQLLLRAPSA